MCQLVRCDTLRKVLGRQIVPSGFCERNAGSGSQAGFNRLSQHLDDGGAGDGDDEGATGGGSAVSGTASFAGPANGCLATGPGELLGGDREGREDRRRCCRGRRVVPCWIPVVPSRWRCEPMSFSDRVGPLSLVLRARGDCAVSGSGPRCARGRSPARPVAFDDLPGAAPERFDPNFQARIQSDDRAVARRAACTPTQDRQARRQRPAPGLRPGTPLWPGPGGRWPGAGPGGSAVERQEQAASR